MNWKTWVTLGVAVLIICLLAAWQMSPRVLSIQPAGEELHGRQPIKIQFSRAMDPASVNSHFSLTPALAGEISWNGEADLLTFLPEQSWPSGQTILLQVSGGARSRLRLPLLGNFQTDLKIGPYLLTYLWPADGPSNLYLVNPLTAESQALTDFEGGILDYSIHPDGVSILYSYPTPNGTSSIARLEGESGLGIILVECDDGLCLSPRAAPDGNLLAYEFISRERGSSPGIRVVNLETGLTTNPGDPDDYLENPLWSPSGWLAYYNQTRKGFAFWNPGTGQIQFLPNETGGDGSWSADGRYFICSEILFTSETLAPRHLILYDLREETALDISRGNFLEDLNPSLAPYGLAVAFSRKSLDPQDWTPGRQLWVLDIETGQEQQLTDEVDFHHSSISWHPGGEQLAYVRYNQATLSDPPEIWLINKNGSSPLRLIIDGFDPAWIP